MSSQHPFRISREENTVRIQVGSEIANLTAGCAIALSEAPHLAARDIQARPTKTND